MLCDWIIAYAGLYFEYIFLFIRIYMVLYIPDILCRAYTGADRPYKQYWFCIAEK